MILEFTKSYTETWCYNLEVVLWRRLLVWLPHTSVQQVVLNDSEVSWVCPLPLWWRDSPHCLLQSVYAGDWFTLSKSLFTSFIIILSFLCKFFLCKFYLIIVRGVKTFDLTWYCGRCMRGWFWRVFGWEDASKIIWSCSGQLGPT